MKQQHISLPFEWDLQGLSVEVNYQVNPAFPNIGVDESVELDSVLIMLPLFTDRRKRGKVDLLPILSGKMVEAIEDEILDER